MGFACAQRLCTMVDTLVAVDLDADSLTAAVAELRAAATARVEPFPLDVTDRDGVAELAARSAELGTLRAVAHAAGISPTMADWRRIFAVDLVGSAILVDALRPLAVAGTALVCFASMAPTVAGVTAGPDVAAVLDAPLEPDFLDRCHAVLGPGVEDTGAAYSWAKLGVRRLARREAVRLGPVGARVCSVSPGIIDTPQGRQEAAHHTDKMDELVRRTPLARRGRAEEVAAVVAFALSAEASFLNGIDILVDGGVCAAIGS
jgi:NAD(P)-dependent dehydrogenase (short-subunit alcohol dehydrogenase family)